jgi:hypothetical protein
MAHVALSRVFIVRVRESILVKSIHLSPSANYNRHDCDRKDDQVA